MKCPRCNINIAGTGKQWIDDYRRVCYIEHIHDCPYNCKKQCDDCLLFGRHKECKNHVCECTLKGNIIKSVMRNNT